MGILELNIDELVLCASRLDARDLISMGLSCKRLCDAVYADPVWRLQGRIKWPPKLTASGVFEFSGGREAFLERINASQQFRFTDPESWEVPCPFLVIKNIVFDGERVIATQGSNLVVAEGVSGNDTPPLSYLRDHSGRITCMRMYSTDCAGLFRNSLAVNKLVVTCSNDKTIRLWGKDSAIRTFKGHSSGVSALADKILGDGLLASGGMDATVRLWSVFGVHRRRSALQGTLIGHETYIKELAVAGHNPSILVSAAKDSKLRVWDINSKACVGSSRGPGVPAGLKCFGSICYVAGDKSISAIDLRTMQTIFSFRGHKDVILAMAVSSSGSILCTGGNDQCGLLWDVRKCEEPFASLGNHEGPVSSVYVDNYKAITAGPDDTKAYVWDSHNGTFATSLDHSMGVTALACQGTKVATAVCSDTSVLYYRDYSNCTNELPRDESGPSKFWDM